MKTQDEPVKWYHDKFSGKTMERPGWNELDRALRSGKVSKIVCWRLDRLGRTTAGLCQLFNDLQERKVDLVSLRDCFSLETPSGRHFARMMASQAEYDNEIRAEIIRAGQAAVRAKGKRWGGSKAGVRKKVTAVQARIIREMHGKASIASIAKATGLSRPTVYSVLATGMMAGTRGKE